MKHILILLTVLRRRRWPRCTWIMRCQKFQTLEKSGTQTSNA